MSLEQNLDSEKLNEAIRKHSLLNAYRHNGKAQPQVVLGKILGEMPHLKPKAIELLGRIEDVVNKINSLSVEEQERLIEESWPELLEGKEKIEEKVLPLLPNVGAYPIVVTRFSPNPDCVLHIGSARAFVLSWKYAEIYHGKFYLRFEDTDPRYKKPVIEFYDSIREDLAWLGCKWNEEFIQSDRIDVYYKYAESLVGSGKAYVCTCKPQNFRETVLAMKPCPCRNLPSETQLERWSKMLNGTFGEVEAVVRIKTDLNHPNPAIRDWPALRIIDTKRFPHPRVGDKYRVWPLYNFSCGLDDHLLDITHIIRGKEHLSNELRQHFLYSHLGWDYPQAVHYGRLKIAGADLSKSKIKRGVEKGFYSDYGDPRLATLIALRRRGIKPEAIIEMMLDVGIKPVDVTLSWETLYAFNRKIIDQTANRYFFVSNPVTLQIEEVEKPYTVRLFFHPDHPERGFRVFDVKPKDGVVNLLVSDADLKLLQPEKIVRLMGLFNVEVKDVSREKITATFHSEFYEEARKLRIPLIHYIGGQGIPTGVIMSDGSVIQGLADEACKQLKPSEIIQFERFGFVRVDSLNSKLTVYFAHR